MKQLALSQSLAWIAAALLFACASEGSGVPMTDSMVPPSEECGHGDCSTGAGEGESDAGACVSDADCASGQRCDRQRQVCARVCNDEQECGALGRCTSEGYCTPRQRCDADDACTGTLTCNTCLGVCVSAFGQVCQRDENCDFDEFCDPCVARCLPRGELCAPCELDMQCGEAADRCLTFQDGRRYCGRSCGSCPAGFSCDPERAQCVPLTGSCEARRGCDEDADCPGIQICSATFQCVPGCGATADSAAEADAECAGELVCSAGRCTEPCTSNETCAEGLECRPDGKCWRPDGCLTSRDCTEAGTFCDRREGVCVPGCQVDSDCMEAGLECVAGTCEARRCSGNYACAFGEICDLDAGTCRPSPDPHCSPCDGSDPDSCGAANLCASLQDDEGNSQGDWCFLACASEDPFTACPQGYQCTRVEVDGAPRDVCFRPLCDDDPI